MNFKPRLWQILVAGIALFGFTFSGMSRGWFKGMSWVDIPLHFIGGIILGFLFWWLIELPMVQKQNVYHGIFSFLGFASLGNYVWEVYEYMTWNYAYQVVEPWILYSPTVSDVLSDMILASFGSLVAYFFYRLVKRQKIENPI